MSVAIFHGSASAQISDGHPQVARALPQMTSPGLITVPGDILTKWDRERTRFAIQGVALDFYYVSDFLGNPYGGHRQRFSDWGRIRGTVDIELGKITRSSGPVLHARAIWQNGGNLGSSALDSTSNPSSLVSRSVFRLDSWWLEQPLFNRHLFLRGGQFAGQDFYGVQEYSSSYLLEPLGYALGNLFSTIYESFDPESTPAAEVRFTPDSHVTLRSAVLDGNRNPEAENPTGIGFIVRDSPVIAAEASYLTSSPDLDACSAKSRLYPGKYKIGSLYNGGNFIDPLRLTTSPGNYLLYFMANQAIYRSDIGTSRGIDLAFAIDWSPPDVNQQYEQLTAGIRIHAPVSSRAEDILSVGIIHSGESSNFKHAELIHSLPRRSSEQAFEVNYRYQLSKGFAIQPAIQYFHHLGGAPQNGDGLVAGFRVTVQVR